RRPAAPRGGNFRRPFGDLGRRSPPQLFGRVCLHEAHGEVELLEGCPHLRDSAPGIAGARAGIQKNGHTRARFPGPVLIGRKNARESAPPAPPPQPPASPSRSPPTP